MLLINLKVQSINASASYQGEHIARKNMHCTTAPIKILPFMIVELLLLVIFAEAAVADTFVVAFFTFVSERSRKTIKIIKIELIKRNYS